MFQQSRLRKIIVEQALVRGSVTRGEIADLTGVRLATVIQAVRSLLDEGILEEPGRPDGESTGRRPSPLCIRSGHSHFLGIALDPEAVRVVLLDAAGRLLESAIAPLDSKREPDNILRQVATLADGVCADAAKTGPLKISGAGFADPGLVDESRGISLRAVNLPGWESVHVAATLAARLGCPVFVRPEMSARAFAERLLEPSGEGRGCFHLNMGRGIGGAYTQGREVFVGDSCAQMEIGHIVVEEAGTLCQCGNRGCLEAYAGIDGLASRVGRLTQKAVGSLLVGREFSLHTFVEAVRMGDKAALRIAIETARHLGKALAAACSLLNPARVSLSGPFFSLHDLLSPVLRESLTLGCLPQTVTSLEWHVSNLGDDAPAHGAALVARHLTLTQCTDTRP